ncbi:hypothetical protein T11_15567 [Trichinella zimbabwensis]|uniref:Uncharacterized protein n=1 Tax=Trichinella zimbabwensis TaxID=268475 RepID=A0A0V1HTT8_9BILA|nr:hypothetical protein T11_15567 [Trichinella zimbabwensis]
MSGKRKQVTPTALSILPAPITADGMLEKHAWERAIDLAPAAFACSIHRYGLTAANCSCHEAGRYQVQKSISKKRLASSTRYFENALSPQQRHKIDRSSSPDRVHTHAYDNDNDNDDDDVGQSSDEKLKQLESSRYVLECPDCVGQWSRSKTGGTGDQPGQTRPNQTRTIRWNLYVGDGVGVGVTTDGFKRDVLKIDNGIWETFPCLLGSGLCSCCWHPHDAVQAVKTGKSRKSLSSRATCSTKGNCK